MILQRSFELLRPITKKNYAAVTFDCLLAGRLHHDTDVRLTDIFFVQLNRSRQLRERVISFNCHDFRLFVLLDLFSSSINGQGRKIHSTFQQWATFVVHWFVKKFVCGLWRLQISDDSKCMEAWRNWSDINTERKIFAGQGQKSCTSMEAKKRRGHSKTQTKQFQFLEWNWAQSGVVHPGGQFLSYPSQTTLIIIALNVSHVFFTPDFCTTSML